MGKRKLDNFLDEEPLKVEKSPKIYAKNRDKEDLFLEVKVLGEHIKEENGKKIYEGFEVDGDHYSVNDSILIKSKLSTKHKPQVAIITKIVQTKDGKVHVEGQWFYRPEEVENKDERIITSLDSREIFYSFHIDEVPSDSIMQKCEVRFIPQNKKLPQKHKYTGFIVRWVYDVCNKKLLSLSDKDFEEPMQKQIDLLLQKTCNDFEEFFDSDKDEHITHMHKDVTLEMKNSKKLHAKKTLAPLNLSHEEFNINECKVQASTPSKKVDYMRVETPTSVGIDLEISTLLKEHDVLLGVHARDRWLQKLLQTIRTLCRASNEFKSLNESREGFDEHMNDVIKDHNLNEIEGNKNIHEDDKKDLGEGDLVWPNIAFTAIEVISAIERLNHDSHKNDLHKYNIKMRQLDFNIKNNEILARRLLTKELEPITILNMSPDELKDGYIATPKDNQKPCEPEAIQMANVGCSICTEHNVGVIDIIHVSYGDRYQLECLKCGHTWYSTGEAVSSLKAANDIH